MIYKPTDRFNANMKMIEDILLDVKKEIGGPEGKASYVLCVVIEQDDEKGNDFVHSHGTGYLLKVVRILEEILEKGPDSPLIEKMTGIYKKKKRR